MELLQEPEFWYGVGFVLFVALALYLGTIKTVAKGLDERGRKIAADLAEASRLRQEAEAIVAEYEKKRSRAEAEAAEIVATAKAEAERAAEEARARVADFVERRTQAAETKIAQAESQAIAEVRGAAADTAIKAATAILHQAARQGEVAERLIAGGIDEVRSKLH
ncbi:MAG TPA: ATP F0F1 synthase subunit B [Hyphomicrobiales bacterium]|nr:ATP F0F1 synthase subunit B [Hyphomicrobiales bacterium]